MSHTKNVSKTTDKNNIDNTIEENEDIITCNESESCTYAVTVSKKSSSTSDTTTFCSDQKSFISIHSTDHLCPVGEVENVIDLDECNVEVLSLNKVFPSTSEDSLSNGEGTDEKKKKNLKRINRNSDKSMPSYIPTNSKSSTMSDRQKEIDDDNAVCSDFNIPKNTLHVLGSNPGEPKMSYQDPPKKMSKTMKKILRKVDKHKKELSKSAEKTISYATMRGILKDVRCDPECTGDSTFREREDYAQNIQFTMDFDPQDNNVKQTAVDKNVSFNTQVLIFHFTGDLCVGQSIETLSKEKDQQERNSELRRTFLTKYNELWPTQK